MTTLTNTGNHLMTAAFYNELRAMETEDVRDDDTLRLVSMVSIAVSKVATAPRATPSQAFAAALHGDEGRSLDSLAEQVLARVMWDQRGMET